MQFHLELEPDTVQNWAQIPEYAASLEAVLGPGAVDEFDAACAARMKDFNALAERVYINWLQTSAQV